jgi:hypothetical protein
MIIGSLMPNGLNRISYKSDVHMAAAAVLIKTSPSRGTGAGHSFIARHPADSKTRAFILRMPSMPFVMLRPQHYCRSIMASESRFIIDSMASSGIAGKALPFIMPFTFRKPDMEPSVVVAGKSDPNKSLWQQLYSTARRIAQ